MANPQPTDAHLRIAHSIEEQLMVSQFTEQQRRILDLILRLSWGCAKHSAYIPKQRDFEVVGISEGHIKAHLDWLVSAKVILRDGNYYSFNKDFDQWRVSRALKFSQEKLTELVSLNLNRPDEDLRKTEVPKEKLTEKVSENLRKREESTYGKGKFSTSELALPKESIKESINNNNNNYIDNNNKNITTITDPEKPEITPDDICSLYENEIGLLTPLMRKNIEESLNTFPADWIADAIKTASESNVKKWSYIAKVLDNWARDGKPDAITTGEASKYTSGKFGKYVQTGPPKERLICEGYSVETALEIIEGYRGRPLAAVADRIKDELTKRGISFTEKIWDDHPPNS
jgi:DnaD/phage-associated family protein